jgi:hypothetical protein
MIANQTITVRVDVAQLDYLADGVRWRRSVKRVLDIIFMNTVVFISTMRFRQ